jgi:hypothetical protein
LEVGKDMRKHWDRLFVLLLSLSLIVLGILTIRQIYFVNQIKPYSLREADLVLSGSPEMIKENVERKILPEIKVQIKNIMEDENDYLPDYTETDIDKMVVSRGIPFLRIEDANQLKIDKHSIIHTFKMSQDSQDEKWMFIVYLDDKPTCFNFSVGIDANNHYYIDYIELKGYRLAQLLHIYGENKNENDIIDTYLLCARHYFLVGKKKDHNEIAMKGPTTMVNVPCDERFGIYEIESYTVYPAEVINQLLEKIKIGNDQLHKNENNYRISREKIRGTGAFIGIERKL